MIETAGRVRGAIEKHVSVRLGRDRANHPEAFKIHRGDAVGRQGRTIAGEPVDAPIGRDSSNYVACGAVDVREEDAPIDADGDRPWRTDIGRQRVASITGAARGD